MSSSDRTRHLSLCPATWSSDREEEPGTHRMSPDEVRALLSRIEDAPTSSCDAEGASTSCGAEDAPRPLVRGVVDLADPNEPPTLLYRPRKRLTRAMLRMDAPEPATRTLHGLGPSRSPRIVFGSSTDQAADDDDGWDAWVRTAELSALAADRGNAAETPAYASAVSPSAPGPLPRPDEVPACAGAADAEESAAARFEPSRSALARRSRRLGFLVIALLFASPVIVVLVRWLSTPANAGSDAHSAEAPRSEARDVTELADRSNIDDVTLMEKGQTSADVGLPDALWASARALDAAAATDPAARMRRAALARATEQLLAGETIEALAALRALSAGEPRVPMLGRVVRQLEEQLRACAARGGDACR